MAERHEIRWGGFAGLVFAVTSVVGYFITGNPPRVDDSQSQITSYFDGNRGQLMTQAILISIAAAALVWFAAALAQALRERMPTSDVPGAILGGVTLAAGLVFIGAILTATLAFRAAAPATTVTLYVALSVLFTMIGIASALPLSAAAVGIVASHVMPQWIAWFAGLAAVVSVVGAFGIVNDSGNFVPGGPVMSLVPFLVTAAWVVATSVFMVREHLPEVTVAPQAMGHA